MPQSGNFVELRKSVPVRLANTSNDPKFARRVPFLCKVLRRNKNAPIQDNPLTERAVPNGRMLNRNTLCGPPDRKTFQESAFQNRNLVGGSVKERTRVIPQRDLMDGGRVLERHLSCREVTNKPVLGISEVVQCSQTASREGLSGSRNLSESYNEPDSKYQSNSFLNRQPAISSQSINSSKNNGISPNIQRIKPNNDGPPPTSNNMPLKYSEGTLGSNGDNNKTQGGVSFIYKQQFLAKSPSSGQVSAAGQQRGYTAEALQKDRFQRKQMTEVSLQINQKMKK